MKRKRRVTIMAVVSVLLVISVWLSVVAVGIVNYGKTDEKCSCEVAIVLGAATENGEVSPVYRERLNHGIWLYRNQYVDYLIFTGGVGEGNTQSDAFAAKEYAVEKGIPADAIFLEERSAITEENLKYAKEIMEENSWNTALIVSDPLHMKRAMLMAKDFGIESYSSPTPTSMYRSLKTKLPFLAREEFFYIGYWLLRPFR